MRKDFERKLAILKPGFYKEGKSVRVIEVRNVTKKFGHVTALNGIHFSVEEGEIYGFIGPNGAGKSTTIRILLGMLKADSGKAEMFGRNVWEDAIEIHKRIAYVPGDVNLWPNLTGGEVIDFLLSLGGNANPVRKKELLERFDLDPRKKCGTYSKGNRQKVALVAAFARDADLYILDEPTTGLDPLMERTFQECVREAKKIGKTIFLSSHILSEVEKLCDRLAIIRQGEIIEEGSLSELRHLTRTTVTVRTKEKLTGLKKLPGVHRPMERDGEWNFQLDADQMGSVISYLSRFGVEKLEVLPPTLEDLFIRYYERSSNGGK